MAFCLPAFIFKKMKSKLGRISIFSLQKNARRKHGKFLFTKKKMDLFEITIKGTGRLEKDIIKVTFQIVKIIFYGMILHYLFQLNTIF